MTDFIELHNTYDERLLINIAAIAAVIPVDDVTRIDMVANSDGKSG